MSHPTDWEKPGIEPATPGLQAIGLSPTPWPVCTFFVAVFLVYNQCWPGGFCGFLCPGTPEGSNGIDYCFKASQKTGPRLRVSSDRLVNQKGGKPLVNFKDLYAKLCVHSHK